MAYSREEITDIFTKMAERLATAKTDGINATVQFDLSGDNGGMYWLKIADGKSEVGEGAVDNPKMTLKATADDLAAVLSGATNPMQAFMQGKIKIQGDTGLAMKLMPLING